MINKFKHIDFGHKISVDVTSTGLLQIEIKSNDKVSGIYITPEKAKELGEALILITNEIK